MIFLCKKDTPLFEITPGDVFGQLADIPSVEYLILDNKVLVNLLLFGDDKLDIVLNRRFLETTILFIEKAEWCC